MPENPASWGAPVKLSSPPMLFENVGEWVVSFSYQVSAFVDESGKFKDHNVIAIACVASYTEDLTNFTQEWNRHLVLNGLNELHANKVLNYNRPLSKKNPEVGLQRRIRDLLPFVSCIRKHLQVVMGCVVDVRIFKKLPPYFLKVFGKDPSLLAFMRVMMQVSQFAAGRDRVQMICDEDEGTVSDFYRLYRRFKQVWPGVRNRFVGISFVDDRYLFALQAADFIASIIRLETSSRLTKKSYDYQRLYRALAATPDPKIERLWYLGIATASKKNLIKTAEDVIAQLKKERKLG